MSRRSAVILAPIAAVLLALAGCTQSTQTADPTSTADTTSAADPTSAAAVPAPTSEVFTPVLGSVLSAPEAVPSTDGKTHLAYELLLSNVLSQSITLDAVTVNGDGTELLSLSADGLLPWMKVYGTTSPTRVLGPGQQALVFLDVVVASADDVPQVLSHEIDIAPEKEIAPIVQTTMTETVAVTAVSAAAPIVIGPPLRGAGWLDGNSCCAVTPHRAAVNPINGGLHAPERFAIDFVQLDAAGKIFGGPIDELSSYAFYGADIIAVADGPIVSMVWELPQQKPGANPTGLTVEEYGGNHVVQDLGNGRYAFYAHLQGDNPEKLAVGQQLKRGDLIGKLGNSGNTDAPHLHFHIMDSPLPLASNGLPFLIDSFDLAGTLQESAMLSCITASVSCGLDTATAAAMTEKGPLYLDVLDFAN